MALMRNLYGSRGIELSVDGVVVGRLKEGAFAANERPDPRDLYEALPSGQVIELHGPETWFPVPDPRPGMSGRLSTIRIAQLGTVKDLPRPVFYCAASCPWCRSGAPFCGLFLVDLERNETGSVPGLKCSEYTGNVRDRLPEVEVVSPPEPEELVVSSIAPCRIDLED